MKRNEEFVKVECLLDNPNREEEEVVELIVVMTRTTNWRDNTQPAKPPRSSSKGSPLKLSRLSPRPFSKRKPTKVPGPPSLYI